MSEAKDGLRKASDLRKRAEKIARAAEDSSGEVVSPEAAMELLTELRVHQIELEMQNDELRRVQAELETAKERYVDLYELAPVGYFTLSERGLILEANLTASTLLGAPRAKLVRQPLTHFVRPDDQDIFYKYYKTLFAGEEAQVCEVRLARSEARPVWVSLEATVVQDDGGTRTCRLVISDITERKQAEVGLQEAGRTAERYLDIAAEVIVSLDAQGNVTLLNGSGHRLLGYAPGELIGKNWFDTCLPEDMWTEVRGVFAKLMDGAYADVQTYENPVITRNGNRVDLLWHNTLLRDTDDRIVGLLSSAEDITERKRAEDEILRLNTGLEERVQERTEELDSSNEECQMTNEELSAANLKLEDATRAKSDFLASMSHELRTPLNSIIGFSGIMLQGLAGELNEEQRKQLEMINNSGRHLLELVNDILDLSKIESAQDQPTIRKLGVGAVAREMFDSVGPMAEAKGIEMRWTCPEGLRPILTDRLRVGQILLNLMGNAVKFTEHGYVRVNVSQDESGVTVAVEDSGRGIPVEDLERVFDDFYQVSPHSSAKSEGTGLGLAVSRRLAESIGARIEVTSEPERGSAFTLHIPERSRERDLPVGQSRIEL